MSLPDRTMLRTCDCCAEQKEGVIYYDDDPDGATLCPDCVAGLRERAERGALALVNLIRGEHGLAPLANLTELGELERDRYMTHAQTVLNAADAGV